MYVMYLYSKTVNQKGEQKNSCTSCAWQWPVYIKPYHVAYGLIKNLVCEFYYFFFSPLHKATCSLDFLIEKKELHCNTNIGLKIYCEKTACVNMSRCTNILEIQKTAVF